MPRGGARIGAGRPKGGVNRLTGEAVKRAKKGGILPLDFLLEVMRSEKNELNVRIDAAKAAAPYLHARLAAIEHTGNVDSTVTFKTVYESAN